MASGTSMVVPIVTKKSERNKPLNAFNSLMIWCAYFVSAKTIPARNAPNESLKLPAGHGGHSLRRRHTGHTRHVAPVFGVQLSFPHNALPEGGARCSYTQAGVPCFQHCNAMHNVFLPPGTSALARRACRRDHGIRRRHTVCAGVSREAHYVAFNGSQPSQQDCHTTFYLNRFRFGQLLVVFGGFKGVGLRRLCLQALSSHFPHYRE